MSQVPKKSLSRAERALRAMHGKRALLIGDVMLDAYVFGETVRVSREAPVLVVQQEHLEHRLGGAANTAANLAALGIETRIATVAGSDPEAATLRAMLEQEGIDCRLFSAESGITRVKTRILAGAFAAAKQQVLRLDREPLAGPSQAALAHLAQRLEEHATWADVIVVSDYGGGVVTGPVLEMLHHLARAGHAICVDSRYRLHAFVGMSVLTPNVPEAEAAVGYSLHEADNVHRAGAELMAQQACGACLITRGQKGMTLFRRDAAPCHVDIVGTDEVTDVTGAGDAVIATMAAALAAQLGLVNGMRLANCAAGIVVTRLGTSSARPAEIIAAIEAHKVKLEPWEAA